MSIEQTTATGANYWASYFINGDASGLTASEKAAADRWLEVHEPWYPVSDVEDSERFTWSYNLYTFLPYPGGSVIDYVMHKVKP